MDCQNSCSLWSVAIDIGRARMLVCHIRDRPNLDAQTSPTQLIGLLLDMSRPAQRKRRGRFRVSFLYYTCVLKHFLTPGPGVALVVPTQHAAASSLLYSRSRSGLSVAKNHQGRRHHGHTCKEGVGSVVVLRVIFQCCGQELLEGNVNHDATDQTEQDGKGHRADDLF